MFNLIRYALLIVPLVAAGPILASDIHRELEDIANRLATKIEETKRTKVAVADFTDLDGTSRQFGRFVSEELSTNLVLAARGFSVIDRNHLRTILREQKLSMSGLMDPENQKKLGKILGVDALVLGSINPFGENYRITFKVVATDTAEVVAADRGMVPKTPATDQLWDAIIREDLAGGPAPTIPVPPVAPSPPVSPPRQGRVPETIANPNKGEYGSQYLTFSIESLGVNKDKTTATLVGRLSNVSKGEIYIAAYPSQQNNPAVSMVDDAGNLWLPESLVGLTTYPYRSEYMMQHRTATKSPYNNYNINNYFGLLTPGQSQPVNVAFKLKVKSRDQVPGNPKVFSFSANLYLKVPDPAKSGKAPDEEDPDAQWRYTSTAIGISGIKLQ